MVNANFTKDHTVCYIVSVLVNTWGRIKTEFKSVLEEVVSVITTVLQMVALPRSEVLATTKLHVNSDAYDLNGSTSSDFYRDLCVNYITLRPNAILFSSLWQVYQLVSCLPNALLWFMASSATRVTASHQRLPQAPEHSVLGREFSCYRMDEFDFLIVKENCL